MSAKRPLLIASSNKGKLVELRAMLPGFELLSLRDVTPIELDEPGEDYSTNAIAKAVVAANMSGLPTLADDSGLEVDALAKAPGWFSARYGGTHGNDAANRARLLRAMEGVPDALRRAVFRCTVALADPKGPLGDRVLLFHGSCEGRVERAARGDGGFGYDPIIGFESDPRTLAELDQETKNRVSHRARAVAAAMPALRAYLAHAGAGLA